MVHAARPDATPESKLQAATVLGLLSKSQLNWKTIVEGGALPNLVGCLMPNAGAKTKDWGLQRASMIALFELAFSTPAVKHELANLGAMEKLIELLQTSTNKDVK